MTDIRWLQRFGNYQKALSQLQSAVTLAHQRPLSLLEKQGLIQAFEYTHELAWKTLKDFLKHRGSTEDIFGSKDATRQAFTNGLIDNGDVWMQMIKSRNLTSHTYDESTVEGITTLILNEYISCFTELAETLKNVAAKE
ncbi:MULTISPECIES: nucleotidyltransferase substrate binding protein [Cysteiniphilum]|uniref:Nucleotidyltransferase n=1 Tax=Cysteiniphilum litorale TaxID=2056700 RepID=A0A8J3E8V3_9GAMM|nr:MULTISPECIES: nucleotidyltransferase substrate binding protein [Cysteiniphilum]GGF98604.1 nucleotidyltransferase [Cysteiniphilum litorale]